MADLFKEEDQPNDRKIGGFVRRASKIFLRAGHEEGGTEYYKADSADTHCDIIVSDRLHCQSRGDGRGSSCVR